MTAVKKTEVAALERVSAPASPQGESATILSMIERVLANPDFPVDKLERLFDLYQKSQTEQARKAYYAAFSEMQPNLPVIEKKGEIKNKAGQKQSGYPKWEDVVEQIQPVLADYGFGISFDPQVKDGVISVICILSHRDGYLTETRPYELPADTSGSKNAVQAVGSSTSYAKRYTAFAKLNIVSRDPADGLDDDGVKGAAGASLNEEQLKAIRQLLSETNTKEEAFLHHITKTDSLEEVPAGAYESLKGFLTAKKKKQKVEQEAPV